MSDAGHSDFAWVALGANLPHGSDNPAATLRAVLPELQKLGNATLLASSFYVSDPKDCPPGSPRYVNAVVGLAPGPAESPESLLLKLQTLEQRFGRRRSDIRNAARTLDLDLLAFGAEFRNTPALTLPHPRAHQRRFVLQPWIEIAGVDFLLRGRPLGEWLGDCHDSPLLRLQ
jgi:2-amino-4-hydroxy-6-hydroxymethyldihydropteridine diphosphokinase